MADLNCKLSAIQHENEEPFRKAELSILEIESAIAELKHFIINYQFRSDAEEIQFFKELKPQFSSKLIYQTKIFNLETRKPPGQKDIRIYLENELLKLSKYFEENNDFYRYYRTQSDYLDHKYFLRGKYDIRLTTSTHMYEADSRFCTLFDFKLAKILAKEQVRAYLENELSTFDKKTMEQAYAKPTLKWTASKTSLTELIYALHYDGAFGKVDLKEIAAYFQNVFEIDLGDFYHTFTEIKARKNGKTKFLDSLKDSLLKRMDDADEHRSG